ncbi:MAG: hypothetical protein WBB65_14495, partial [Anaerolineales bacterium]
YISRDSVDLRPKSVLRGKESRGCVHGGTAHGDAVTMRATEAAILDKKTLKPACPQGTRRGGPMFPQGLGGSCRPILWTNLSP